MAQPIISSYPLPMSMLFPRGIDHNTSERMLTKKMWDHAIEVKKIFVPSKRKMIYLLLREERGKIYEFINKQLRKEYIRLLKLP